RPDLPRLLRPRPLRDPHTHDRRFRPRPGEQGTRLSPHLRRRGLRPRLGRGARPEAQEVRWDRRLGGDAELGAGASGRSALARGALLAGARQPLRPEPPALRPPRVQPAAQPLRRQRLGQEDALLVRLSRGHRKLYGSTSTTTRTEPGTL